MFVSFSFFFLNKFTRNRRLSISFRKSNCFKWLHCIHVKARKPKKSDTKHLNLTYFTLVFIAISVWHTGRTQERKKNAHTHKVYTKLWMWAEPKLTKKQTIRARYYWCVTTNSNKWAGKPSMSHNKSPQRRERKKDFVCQIVPFHNQLRFLCSLSHYEIRYNFFLLYVINRKRESFSNFFVFCRKKRQPFSVSNWKKRKVWNFFNFMCNVQPVKMECD